MWKRWIVLSGALISVTAPGLPQAGIQAVSAVDAIVALDVPVDFRSCLNFPAPLNFPGTLPVKSTDK